LISAFNPKIDKSYSTTYSLFYYHYGYYKTNLVAKIYDFKYILHIELDAKTMYIVNHKNDVIDGMFNESGMIDMSVVSKHANRDIKGTILYDIKGVKKSEYIPYFLINNECIKNVQVKYKQTPSIRLWNSVEDCKKYSRIHCINSESCSLNDSTTSSTTTKGKQITSFKELLDIPIRSDNDSCTSNHSHQKMQLSQLNTVMLPFKFYVFTEFMTKPFDIDIDEQSTGYFKPNGLWFSQGAEWLQHMKKTNYNMTKYNYLFTLEVDLSKLILITNLIELHKFTSLYGNFKAFKKDTTICVEINWKRAIEETKKAGILISPNINALINKHKKEYVNTTTFSGLEWYLTWDIASGAIWNKQAIAHYNQIYQRESGVFVELKKGDN
jgi:hypothetical protein